MNVILEKHGDAVLGALLDPINVTSMSGCIADAIDEAIKVWAPTAVVEMVRFGPNGPAALMGPTLCARVYAIHKRENGKIILQISSGQSGHDTNLAIVDLCLPNVPA